MTDSPTTPPSAEPVAREFERRMNWGALPAILFLLMLASLAVIATYSTIARPRTAHGLPEDADMDAARLLLAGHMRSPASDLRFFSALAGESPPGSMTAADHDRLAAARERLERTLTRHALDPRILATLAHVELALHRSDVAEAHYRLALEFTPHYGEARLGLGLALAQRSYLASNPLERRRLQLRSLAQFTAVRPGDPAHLAALHNRAAMALLAGRRAEADRLADDYLSRDPSGPWAERMRAMFGRTG